MENRKPCPNSMLGTACVEGENGQRGKPLKSQPRTPGMDVGSRKHLTENPPWAWMVLVIQSKFSVALSLSCRPHTYCVRLSRHQRTYSKEIPECLPSATQTAETKDPKKLEFLPPTPRWAKEEAKDCFQPEGACLPGRFHTA